MSATELYYARAKPAPDPSKRGTIMAIQDAAVSCGRNSASSPIYTKPASCMAMRCIVHLPTRYLVVALMWAPVSLHAGSTCWARCPSDVRCGHNIIGKRIAFKEFPSVVQEPIYIVRRDLNGEDRDVDS
eukprot:6474448-Amphidinium_carterae.6